MNIPTASGERAHTRFEANRRHMLRDLLEWVQSNPNRDDVREEFKSTVNAMRQIIEIGAAEHAGRR